MVSQEFMNILRKQPHHHSPTTSSSAASSGSERRPLNMQEHEGTLVIKEEKEDFDDTGQSAVGMITVHTDLIIKEEEEDGMITDNTDLIIKQEEEDCSNDWKPSLPQTMINSESNTEASPLHQASKGKKKGMTFFSPKSHTQLEREDKTLLGHSNKRIIKKKIIFDPSDIPSSSQKKQGKKAVRKVKKEVLCSSRTNEHYTESPKSLSKITDDEVSGCSSQSDNDMTCRSCKYCGRYVKREDYMRLHHMKHTGETPHKCPYSYCTNAYRTRWRLTQHLRTHTNNLPYHCPYCNYRGNRSDYLASHVRRIHHKELQQSLQQEKKEGTADNKGGKPIRKRGGILR